MASPAKGSTPASPLAPPTARKLLTKEEAAEQLGPPPHGHAWDDALQQYRPLGEVVVASRLEGHLDLEANLAVFERQRTILAKFVERYLIEAKYDGRGRIVAGHVNDWYRTGDGGKALTKRGAEKLASLFRFARSATRIVRETTEKDYTGATVECVLNDHYNRQVGSGVSSCNTAEASFQSPGARRKYGAFFDKSNKETRPPDYRAAQNDITAKAAKRSFVQAVLTATGADEMFGVGTADEAGTEEREERTRAPEPIIPKTTKGGKPIFGKWAGMRISQVPADALNMILIWCRKQKNEKVWEPLAEAITGALDDRVNKAVDETEAEMFPMNPAPEGGAQK